MGAGGICFRVSVDTDAFILFIAAQFHQVAVGVAEVEAVHGAMGPVPLHDVADEGRPPGLQLSLDVVQLALRDEAEVLCAARRMRRSGLKLSRPRVDGDLAAGEVEVVMPVGLAVLHPQQSDVEVQTSLEVGCRDDEVVNAHESHKAKIRNKKTISHPSASNRGDSPVECLQNVACRGAAKEKEKFGK